jgi:pimeloyl-ACP methyl ester carboxylesterase
MLDDRSHHGADPPGDPDHPGGSAGPVGPAGPSEGTVSVDGHPVWFEARGSGDPLVLLHGGMATNATWDAQIRGLSSRRRIIAPERTAHGHTPDRPGPLTYEQMAEETAQVLRALDLGPVDLLGWSDGGMVGFLLAVHEPGLVRTLATTGSGFSSAGYVPGSMEKLTSLEHDDEDLAIFAALYSEVSPDGPEHFPVVWEKVRRMWSEPFDWSADLERVSAPLLVIVGDDDYVTVGHADEMARRVPQGQLAVIPGASHLVPMEKPELFNRLVLDFVEDPVADTMMPLRRSVGGT